MKAWILILALLHVVQVHNTLAATLVQPDECELIINDFSDAAAFAASINALGHFIGDDGTMLQFSLDGDADALNLVPGPGAFWYTNLRDGDICFDASLYEYLSITVAGPAGGDMRIVLQQRGSDCDITPEFSNIASVTVDERTTLSPTFKQLDIPLSEFGLDTSNLNSIVLGELSGETKITRISLKRACATNLNPTPRTPAPPACTQVVNSFTSETSLTVNEWGGTNSDDLSMKVVPRLENDALILESLSALTSYYFMLAPSCQDVSDQDYLRIRVSAPANFEMKVELQQATSCDDLSSVARTSVLTTSYVNTFDGTSKDIWIPLVDFGSVNTANVVGVFLSGFRDTAIANPDHEITFALENVDFVQSSCITPETPEPFPSTEICGWVMNDFQDFLNSASVNRLGGASNDAGTMTVIQPTNDFGLRLTSADSSSYWFSHVAGVCEVLADNLDYLYIRLRAPTGFDMRIDYITAADCSDASSSLITTSVQASTYVQFSDNLEMEVYVPLEDFGVQANRELAAVQIGAFRDIENPLHISEPATIELLEVSFRPSSCSVVPERPLPPLECGIELDSFDVADTSVNLLALPHGDDGSMGSIGVVDNVLRLVSSGYESYWFTNLPDCFDASEYDGVALRFVDLDPTAEFEVRLTFASSCIPSTPVQEGIRLASTLTREAIANSTEIVLWLPFDAVTPAFDKNVDSLKSIVIGGFRNAGESHEAATSVSFGLDNVELRPVVCPTRPPTTTAEPATTTSPSQTTSSPATTSAPDDDSANPADDISGGDEISPASKSSLLTTTLFIEAAAILIGAVAVFV